MVRAFVHLPSPKILETMAMRSLLVLEDMQEHATPKEKIKDSQILRYPRCLERHVSTCFHTEQTYPIGLNTMNVGLFTIYYNK
jgi:hypothetical protein